MTVKTNYNPGELLGMFNYLFKELGNSNVDIDSVNITGQNGNIVMKNVSSNKTSYPSAKKANKDNKKKRKSKKNSISKEIVEKCIKDFLTSNPDILNKCINSYITKNLKVDFRRIQTNNGDTRYVVCLFDHNTPFSSTTLGFPLY